jgi:hypothetical protein
MTSSESKNDKSPSEEEELVISTSASRVGQPDMPPIVFEGKRYEQVSEGHLGGLGQRTGMLAVFDDDTNERISTLKIYDVEYDDMQETDVQDVFFTRMDLDEKARQIHIENERGRRFIVDLDTGNVQAQD